MDIPVEAEVKYALTQERYVQLPQELARLGFLAAEVVMQQDYYIEHEASSLGGINFSRLRKEAGVYTWNRKQHALDSNGEKVRLEEGRDISEAEFNTLLTNAPGEPIQIVKQRQNFTGQIQDWPATVSLDQVRIGGELKYFLEVEIITDVENGVAARNLCKDWAHNALGSVGPEAAGYLKQYLESRVG